MVESWGCVVFLLEPSQLSALGTREQVGKDGTERACSHPSFIAPNCGTSECGTSESLTSAASVSLSLKWAQPDFCGSLRKCRVGSKHDLCLESKVFWVSTR